MASSLAPQLPGSEAAHVQVQQLATQQHQQTTAACVAQPAVMAAPVAVTFCVQYRCAMGAAVYLSGDTSALGSWAAAPGSAVRMQWSEGDVWTATVALPAGSRLEYKYVVLDPSGRPARWQEGANLVLSLPVDAAASGPVDVVDSWCQRLQLRRRHEPVHGQQMGQQAWQGVWEICGGDGRPSAPPSDVSSNVVSFARPGTGDGRTLASTMGVSDARHSSPTPPVPSQGMEPSLPSLQHELEEVLAAALSAHDDDDDVGASRISAAPGGRRGVQPLSAERAKETDALLGAAVESLRHLQSLALSEQQRGVARRVGGGFGSGGGSPGSSQDVEKLRGAFSPAAPSQDDYEAALAPSRRRRVIACSSGVHGSYGMAPGYGGGDSAGGDARMDPLVAALLSDDCEMCCAYIHNAICGASSNGSSMDP